jgi:hypothetical protein
LQDQLFWNCKDLISIVEKHVPQHNSNQSIAYKEVLALVLTSSGMNSFLDEQVGT